MVTLPIALDSEGHRRLVVAKQAFESGISRAGTDSRSARMLVIIDFDFSAETMLRLAHKVLLPNEQPPIQFPKLQKAVHEALLGLGGAGILEYGEIDRMHSIRNGVQHQAEYPTADQIQRARTAMAIFLQQMCLSIWQQDVASVDEIELVATTKVKELLTSAKASLVQDEPDFSKVTANCWKAFNHTLDAVRSVLVGGSPRSTGTAIFTRTTPDRQHWDSALYEGIQSTQDLALLLAFGIDPVGYLRYLSIVGGQSTLASSNSMLRAVEVEHYAISSDDAKFVYAFCLESILQIENRVGTITQPEPRRQGKRAIHRIDW